MLRSLAATAVIVLSACAGSSPGTVGARPGGTSAPGGSPAAEESASVTIQGFKFVPQTLEVKVNTTVVWTNNDDAAHSTVSGTPTAKTDRWEGSLANKDATFGIAFLEPGQYPYFCGTHGAAMTGTIVVK